MVLYVQRADWHGKEFEMPERNNSITYEIVEYIGAISSWESGWTRELNLISWNGAKPKYDIREWDEKHDRMSKGITLHPWEMRNLVDLYLTNNSEKAVEAGRAREAERRERRAEHRRTSSETFGRLEPVDEAPPFEAATPPPNPKPAAKPGAYFKPEPVGKTGADLKPEPAAKTGADFKPEPAAKPGADLKPEPVAKPGAASDQQSAAKPELEKRERTDFAALAAETLNEEKEAETPRLEEPAAAMKEEKPAAVPEEGTSAEKDF